MLEGLFVAFLVLATASIVGMSGVVIHRLLRTPVRISTVVGE